MIASSAEPCRRTSATTSRKSSGRLGSREVADEDRPRRRPIPRLWCGRELGRVASVGDHTHALGVDAEQVDHLTLDVVGDGNHDRHSGGQAAVQAALPTASCRWRRDAEAVVHDGRAGRRDTGDVLQRFAAVGDHHRGLTPADPAAERDRRSRVKPGAPETTALEAERFGIAQQPRRSVEQRKHDVRVAIAVQLRPEIPDDDLPAAPAGRWG